MRGTTSGDDDRGALSPLPLQAAEQLPGVVRGFIWPTEFLMFSDFVVAAPHAHSALQLVVGLDEPTWIHVDDRWRELPGALIDTDAVHALDATGRLTAIGWIEAESHTGHQLRRRLLGARRWAALDADTAADVAAAWKPAMDRATPCARGHEHWRRGLAAVTGQAWRDAAVEPRIQAVLDHLRRTPVPAPSASQLARVARLSESRLQHLFREQVGVPVRRYLLWQRILTAMSHLATGGSVTDAAHAAGFADGAHLSRVMRRMNGVAASDMGPVSLWLSNCR